MGQERGCSEVWILATIICFSLYRLPFALSTTLFFLPRRGKCDHPHEGAAPSSLPPRLIVQFFERHFRDHVVRDALLEVLGEPRRLLDFPRVPVRERPLRYLVLDLLPVVGVGTEYLSPYCVIVAIEEVRHALLAARPRRVEGGPVLSLDLQEESEGREQPSAEKSAEDGVDCGVVDFEGIDSRRDDVLVPDRSFKE